MSKNDYPMTVPDCSYIRVESFVLALLFCCFLFFFFRLSFPNCISCVSTAMIFAFILTLLLIIGLRLRMLGISKAKLKPIVKPHLMSMKTTIVPLLLSSIESMELLNAEHLREQIVDLILTRTQELSAEQLKFVVKAAVYSQLSWIVFWGSVLGAIVGCLAELASVYVKGT